MWNHQALACFPTFYFEVIIDSQEMTKEWTGRSHVRFAQVCPMVTSCTLKGEEDGRGWDG